MYATDHESGKLTLGVSGMLWENSLVMVDSETGSLWSHILGEAMRGPLQGDRLEKLPSALMEWGEWRASHPDTTLVLMPRSTDLYARGFHDPDSGLVIGLVTDNSSKSWPLSELYDRALVSDQVDEIPVLLTISRESLTTVIFDRRQGGKVLNFEYRNGRLFDTETESEWNSLTGVSISGPCEGSKLKLLPGIISDAAVWGIYYSESPTN